MYSAHQNNVSDRNNDYKRINEEIKLQGFTQDDAERDCLVDRYDYVFWFGDLNYRVNGTRGMVDKLLSMNRLEVMRFMTNTMTLLPTFGPHENFLPILPSHQRSCKTMINSAMK